MCSCSEKEEGEHQKKLIGGLYMFLARSIDAKTLLPPRFELGTSAFKVGERRLKPLDYDSVDEAWLNFSINVACV